MSSDQSPTQVMGQYSEQSTLRIGDPSAQKPSSSHRAAASGVQRRRHHSGSAPGEIRTWIVWMQNIHTHNISVTIVLLLIESVHQIRNLLLILVSENQSCRKQIFLKIIYFENKTNFEFKHKILILYFCHFKKQLTVLKCQKLPTSGFEPGNSELAAKLPTVPQLIPFWQNVYIFYSFLRNAMTNPRDK